MNSGRGARGEGAAPPPATRCNVRRSSVRRSSVSLEWDGVGRCDRRFIGRIIESSRAVVAEQCVREKFSAGPPKQPPLQDGRLKGMPPWEINKPLQPFDHLVAAQGEGEQSSPRQRAMHSVSLLFFCSDYWLGEVTTYRPASSPELPPYLLLFVCAL